MESQGKFFASFANVAAQDCELDSKLKPFTAKIAKSSAKAAR
jgi:hypothetical protein